MKLTPKPRDEVLDEAPVTKIATDGVRAWFGSTEVLKGISLAIYQQRVTAIIGPSGCGKSTFLRCLNRMHEINPAARVAGRILLDDVDVYGKDVNPARLRRRVGMVFQRPNPFPTMSIQENVLAGLTLTSTSSADNDALVQSVLQRAALWDEVKDRLKKPGHDLSGGQQQRLCIARCLAMAPEVILMDEPCSALDPIATSKVEELIHELRKDFTIVIVTHNMQQAARVSDHTAFLFTGELVEYSPTDQLFTKPAQRRTEDYISGRFG
ncbi:MAG: phosphate ABC transporter ATP-binding protein [Polyangiaceae bacterium]|nr:phosphate ABC transporter ATP-binding protein [Polyangiaceae bacterium]